EGEGTMSEHSSVWPQVLFSGFLLALFLFTGYEAMSVSFLAKVFPAGVAIIGLLATLYVIWSQLKGGRASRELFDGEDEHRDTDDGPMGPLSCVLWLAGFVGSPALVSYFPALVTFFVLFLHFIAKARPWVPLMLTALAMAILLTLASALNLTLPQGVLQYQFYGSLRWPLI